MSKSLPPVYAVAAVRLLMPLMVLPVMAGRLGLQEFGRLGLCLVWAAMLALVVEGGFLVAATRKAVVATPGQRLDLAQKVFSARCVLSVPVALLGFCVGAWLIFVEGSSPHRWETALALAGLACAQGWPATWYLQGTSQLHRWAWVELVVHLCLLGACLGWAHSTLAFLMLQWVAGAAIAVLGWFWVWYQLVCRPRNESAIRLNADCGASVQASQLWARSKVRAGLALGWTMMPVSIAGAGFALALPAVAASQLGRGELGLYYLADRIVRALLAAIDPLIHIVYPRIVEKFVEGSKAALRYAACWAVFGLGVGISLSASGWIAWPYLQGFFKGMDTARLGGVLAILGILVPLAMGWRFFAYWLLASARFDRVYRVSIIAGAFVGIGGAGWLAHNADTLAWVAIAAEVAILLTVLFGVLGTSWIRQRRISDAQSATSAS